MKENYEGNAEMIYKTCAAFVLFVLLSLSLYAFIINRREKNIPYTHVIIPEIKENYTTTKLSKYIEYDQKITNKNNKLIVTNNNEEYYLTYENNNITYEKINNISIKTNYTIQIDNNTNKKYIINKSNNTISDLYDNIKEITFDNEIYSYLLLSNNNEYFLLNLETDELIELNKEIFYIDELYKYNENEKNYNVISKKYIKVSNENNKYGIIDYNGNTILEMIYDNIEIIDNNFIVKKDNLYSIINQNNVELIKPYYQEIINYNNYFIAKKDNKYGIIDLKENIIFDFDIDYAKICDKYLIVIKNNKLGIIQDNKLILDYQIEVKNNKIDAYMFNNNIHLSVYLPKIKTYIINDNKIKKIINEELKFIYITDYTIKDEEQLNKLNTYTYTISKDKNDLILRIYDKNYDKYYENTIKTSIDYTKYNIYPTLTKYYTNNNFKLVLNAYNINNPNKKEKEIYYYDLEKRSASNELSAIGRYLENGYRFTLNENNELNVYKNDQLISTHNNIEYYIGGYFFADINGIIYTLEFKNESK